MVQTLAHWRYSAFLLAFGLTHFVWPLALQFPTAQAETLPLATAQRTNRLAPWAQSGLAQTQATGKLHKQGSTIFLNGRRLAVPWRQWQQNPDSGEIRTEVADAGLIQAIGVNLLSTQVLDKQPVAWFSEPEAEPMVLSSRRQGPFRYLDITDLAKRSEWQVQAQGNTLQISSPAARIGTVRQGNHGWGRRIVVTLDRPAPWQVVQRRGAIAVTVDARANAALLQSLEEREEEISDAASEETSDPKKDEKQPEFKLRVVGERTIIQVPLPAGWRPRVWSLPAPNRLIIDLRPDGMAERDILWAPGLRWRQQVLRLGSAQFPVVWLEVDPSQPGLQLKPMGSQPDGQVGTAPLSETAERWQAAAAINGGFFNRNNQLPLGAIRRDGQWLSGPILNRGAIAWNDRGNIKMARLALKETLTTETDKRFSVLLLNSGYVKAGMARYTPAWGSTYTPLTDYEIIVTVQANRVTSQQTSSKAPDSLPFSIPSDGYLLVLRAYKTAASALPPGTKVNLHSATLPDSFSRYPHILGAGPLLLQNRRIVLNANAEQFSPNFSRQAASRSAIGKTSAGTLLIAAFHNRLNGRGPTLNEAAQLMQRLGAVDALNLDGGSSTSLYLGGQILDRPANSAARVHNGVGIFLQRTERTEE